MPEAGEVVLATAIACSPRAPAEARAALRTGLRGAIDEADLDDVLLAASELVTNSVRHAGLGADEFIDVNVRREGATLRLEVCDGGSGFDASGQQVIEPQPAHTSGRGLAIISRLAVAWGVRRTGGKNMVWVRLAAGRKRPGAPDAQPALGGS